MDLQSDRPHTTVLLNEAVDALVTTPDGVYLDGTYGRGGHSRLLLSRLSAGLVRDVMLLGMGSHFELWDAKAYAEHEAAVMQSDMPESLKNFSF